MQLFIRGVSSTQLLDCEDNQTIGEVKNEIAALENLKAEDVRLYSNGAPVSDDSLVSHFKESDIEITVGLPGGKVHGSMARAGKVREQTPKVEKQQKKKKKTGRAKKRKQYNRRFANGVATTASGPGRGPNSNAAKSSHHHHQSPLYVDDFRIGFDI